MDNIVVLTQNLKLESLASIQTELVPGCVLIVSTQFIFENEREIINKAIGVKCEYVDFADLISDLERQKCDEDAYDASLRNINVYYEKIKYLKNEKIVKHLQEVYPCNNKIILCDDLGIEENVWISNHYRRIRCEYYYIKDTPSSKQDRTINLIGYIISIVNKVKRFWNYPIWQSEFNGQKHLFFGSTNRIGYRMNLNFKRASKIENIKMFIELLSYRLFRFVPKNRTIRMTSFHESGKFPLPDCANFNIKKIQDGYLPPNYSSKYLCFFGRNTEFYSWDLIGCHTFQYHHLRHAIMPFRKLLYLPEPKFPTMVKKVLCAASGTGDWTAIKNRSDDDRLVWALGKVAAMFPEVEFIYRCHPVWIHPEHSGVNSINRCAEYISWLNLPNYKISSNIPMANQNGGFVLSYKRSSFEEDLKDVDLVLGEHSVAMIDAGFKGIPFASCNMTGHRDFFEDITKLGFPHCESVDEISNLIKSVPTEEFKSSYIQAVKNYNEMTDREE